MRDGDFPKDVIEALAKRAGYKCSFPNCRRSTIGPSSESATAHSSIGMACHIYSASSGPGARRHNPNIQLDRVRSIENGIWMCFSHGKLIDTDEVRFSVELLKQWKDLAENIARLKLDLGSDQSNNKLEYFNLVENMVVVNPGVNENAIIGNAIEDSCVTEFWGKDISDVIRDAAVEISRNAFLHGGAKSVRISVSSGSIKILDDGGAFLVRELVQNEPRTGGQMAISHLVKNFGNTLLLTQRRTNECNEISIAVLAACENILSEIACSAEVKWNDVSKGNLCIDFSNYADCDVIYAIMPEFMSTSDAVRMDIPDRNIDNKEIILVVRKASNNVLSILNNKFPKNKFINIG